MNVKRGWILVPLSILMLAVYSCNEQPATQVNSEENPVLKNTKGSAHGMMNMQLNFRTHLNGGNEVPAVETDAQGEATFKISRDGTSIHYKLIVANIENVLMAHIHNAPADENGGVVVWLYPASPPPQLIEGQFQGVLAEGTITASDLVGSMEGESLETLIEEMKAGNTYVNVHTTQNKPGEIRGQIR